jgi:hypothetical protein
MKFIILGVVVVSVIGKLLVDKILEYDFSKLFSLNSKVILCDYNSSTVGNVYNPYNIVFVTNETFTEDMHYIVQEQCTLIKNVLHTKDLMDIIIEDYMREIKEYTLEIRSMLHETYENYEATEEAEEEAEAEEHEDEEEAEEEEKHEDEEVHAEEEQEDEEEVQQDELSEEEEVHAEEEVQQDELSEEEEYEKVEDTEENTMKNI